MMNRIEQFTARKYWHGECLFAFLSNTVKAVYDESCMF